MLCRHCRCQFRCYYVYKYFVVSQRQWLPFILLYDYYVVETRVKYVLYVNIV